nr:histidine kinase dimerization/phospho-acceptor domain-containing protein [Suipraeoptans intestinalis]
MEIQELSRVLDGAFSEIYESYERQKKFSVNVAHEVRTPLAILSAKIDVFKKKKTEDPEEIAGSSMQKNIARLSDMVEGIMMLSQKQEVRTQEVNLREILDEILFDLEDMAAEKRWRFPWRETM